MSEKRCKLRAATGKPQTEWSLALLSLVSCCAIIYAHLGVNFLFLAYRRSSCSSKRFRPCEWVCLCFACLKKSRIFLFGKKYYQCLWSKTQVFLVARSRRLIYVKPSREYSTNYLFWQLLAKLAYPTSPQFIQLAEASPPRQWKNNSFYGLNLHIFQRCLHFFLVTNKTWEEMSSHLTASFREV